MLPKKGDEYDLEHIASLDADECHKAFYKILKE